MRVADIAVRHRVAALAALPLTAAVLLTTPYIADRVQSADRSLRDAETIGLTRQASGLVQDLQRERLLSIAYLSDDSAPADQVVRQSAQVDAAASDLLNALGTGGHPALSQALNGLAPLRSNRSLVLQRSIKAHDLRRVYDQSINRVLDGLGSGAEDSKFGNARETRNLRVLTTLLRLDEDNSATGAALLTITADPRDAQRSLADLEAALARETTDRGQFFAVAAADQAALFTAAQQGWATRQVGSFASTVRDWAYAASVAQSGQRATSPNIDQTAVLDAADAQDGLRQLAQEKIARDAAAVATADARTAIWTAFVFGLLTAGLAAAMAWLTIALGRSISRPLGRLHDAAQSIADVAEAELARVTDETAAQDAPVSLAIIESAGSDEIGKLATAFNRVQQASVSLVERQIASRRNAAAMFGNVGRRTQNLAGRQLAMIDEMERSEVDPGLLERLYRLDHVSTRLRRHADSLVVLSGWTEPMLSIDPVDLSDVLRSAMGTIEDFRRVDLGEVPPLLVVPDVATDLLLILSEIMENAASFSPPTTRVEVGARQTANGCTLRVVDRGVGISESRLAEENARLGREERLDLAPTEVLGLFVVGRLCRKHGIRIHLGPTLGGGVTAWVQVPTTHLRVQNAALSLPGPPQTGHPEQRRAEAQAATGSWPATADGAVTRGPVLKLVPPPDNRPAVAVLPAPAALPPRPEPGPGPFDWFRREIEDEIRKVLDRHTDPSAPPPALPAPAEPQPVTGPPVEGLVRRVPGAQMPTGAVIPRPASVPTGFQHLDPEAARAMIEEFNAGIIRATHHSGTTPQI
ncbi:histidine kinase [Kitasatospora sp. NE20-6]|uniref:sensor histidine kinase n=1 Tax=Kitasatospora sp. NE20-6 TaxID=2859066 RepID=UPI0034DCB3A8